MNPIKHFPVVTVSHKVLFTTIPYIRDALHVSEATVVGIIWCIPGIFGFLAWEFKENWRLYRASRPKTLQPLAIGHHGETVRGLLRPGFHSGTIPKLYRKMRTAIRKGERSGTSADRHRFEHDQHHLAIAVTNLIERQILSLLRSKPEWGNLPIGVRRVSMTCQSITSIVAVNHETSSISMILVGDDIHQSVTGLDGITLSPLQRDALNAALCGLAALAATGETVSYEMWERRWESSPEKGMERNQ